VGANFDQTNKLAATEGRDCPVIALCIDPARVHHVWPLVAHLVRAAMRKGRLSEFDDVERGVRGGRMLLWVAADPRAIWAAAVTELHVVNGEKFCTIVACGGHDRGQWLHLLDGLESHAKAEGCAAMRVYGRRGWGKLLKDYRVTRLLLEKTLA
jgi:hypothetical protein